MKKQALENTNNATFSSLAQVKNIIAIGSGKGGVGKSTVTANLATALQSLGYKAGVLDADIYGPSMPMMLSNNSGMENKHGEQTQDKATSSDGKTVEPVIKHGIKSMSIGYLMPENKSPAIWRGPMASGALQQLIRDTQWGELDYLLIDMPPGTGDIQLTLAQKVSLTGALIVTTPQDIALLDARKAIEMFKKVEVPVLGIIENMSMHICSQCQHQEAIFGDVGGENLAKEYEVDLLGKILLAKSIREYADKGQPIVVAQPESVYAENYLDVAKKLIEIQVLQEEINSRKFPEVDV